MAAFEHIKISTINIKNVDSIWWSCNTMNNRNPRILPSLLSSHILRNFCNSKADANDSANIGNALPSIAASVRIIVSLSDTMTS
jgi:hypothetical protein